MEFKPLYYGERMKFFNLHGDIGVCTLWSKVDSAIEVITNAGIDLSPVNSRVAVVANLYGNGLPQMLRNLLWNPQIRYIVIVGKNLSGSREWLMSFFNYGLEEVDFLGTPSFRIRNTNRVLDGNVLPEHFSSSIHFVVFGELGDPDTKKNLGTFFSELSPLQKVEIPRMEPPLIPEPAVTRFPSEPRSHTIVGRTPMEAWSELVFNLYRFGYRNKVAKKSGKEVRIELLNTHVVVENPKNETKECLATYGFSLEKFRDYQRRILDPFKPLDLDYTYGNRLRGYFSHQGQCVDSVQIAADRLSSTPDSRHSYIALWDNNRDLPKGTKCPCFVSAFFRKFDSKLNLTATFRTHNAMDAWPENLYGLMAIQEFVAERAGIDIGPITIFSHSISIDPASLEKAKRIAEGRKTDDVTDVVTGKLGPRFDPNGEFNVTFDEKTLELVVEHSFNGMKIHEYRGKTSEEVEAKLARDKALSTISHALYLGRILARKEVDMRAMSKT